jgi:hypothetical protein
MVMPLRVLGWMVTVGVGSSLLSACPTTSSSFQAASSEVELGPLEVGARGAEVPIGIEAGAPVDWQERTISVRAETGGPTVVVAVRSERGRVLGVAAPGDDVDQSLDIRQRCDGASCTEGLVVSLVPLDDDGDGMAEVQLRPTVAVELSGYDHRSSDQLTLQIGDPEVPRGQGRLVATPPTSVAIDADGRVAGALLELPPASCDGEPWLVVLGAGPIGAEAAGLAQDRPQLRAITESADVSVPAGRAIPLPDDACATGAEDTGSMWVVLAAPVVDGEVRARWSLVGGAGVAEARSTEAISRTTPSEAVPLRSVGASAGSIVLPPARASLHLIEGVDDASAPRTGGGPDWVRTDLAQPPGLGREPGTEQGGALDVLWWRGSGYSPLVVGPCPPVACPDAIEIVVSSEVPGGPPPGAMARAVVSHLLVDVDR